MSAHSLFLIGKTNCIKKKGVYTMYTSNQKVKRRGYTKTNNLTLRSFWPIHKIKHWHRPSPIYNLTQSQNRYKKELLKEWSKLSQFSKALLFLSLQMVPKRYKGATFQAFFLFLPIKKPPQLKSNPHTEECIIHCTQNKAKISCHIICAFRQ